MAKVFEACAIDISLPRTRFRDRFRIGGHPSTIERQLNCENVLESVAGTHELCVATLHWRPKLESTKR
jgi:hypothetical protein